MTETAQKLRETINKIIPLIVAVNESETSNKPLPTKWSKKEI